jgi:hypothetical protein
VSLAFGIGSRLLGLPLPVPLDVIGAPGCFLQTTMGVIVPGLADGSGRAEWSVPMNFSDRFSIMDAQGLVLDAAANALGATFSNGLMMPLN